MTQTFTTGCYAFGWGGIGWFVINLLLNTIAYIVFLPAFRTYITDRTNSGTIHEFLAVTFAPDSADPNHRRLRLLASATTILGLLFAVVFELHLAAVIVSTILHVDTVVAFAFLTLIITLYSAIGGFHTLRFTDILQSWALIVGAIAVVPLLLGYAGSIPQAPALVAALPVTFTIGWPNIVSICVIGSGWFLVAMDQWQRVCATRDPERTRTGMILYFLIISAFALIFGYIGMFDRAIEPLLTPAIRQAHTGGANPLNDFFLLPLIAPMVPPVLMALYGVALIAAAMSTANTFLIVSGHSFVSDLLLTIAGRPSLHNLPSRDERAFLGIARGSIIAMTFFIVVVWILLNVLGLLRDPLSFFFIAYSIQFALLAPMIFSRLPRSWRPLSGPVVASVSLGVLSSVGLGFWFWSLIQAGDTPLGWLKPSEWLTLSPVLTLLVGLLPMFGGRRAM